MSSGEGSPVQTDEPAPVTATVHKICAQILTNNPAVKDMPKVPISNKEGKTLSILKVPISLVSSVGPVGTIGQNSIISHQRQIFDAAISAAANGMKIAPKPSTVSSQHGISSANGNKIIPQTSTVNSLQGQIVTISIPKGNKIADNSQQGQIVTISSANGNQINQQQITTSQLNQIKGMDIYDAKGVKIGQKISASELKQITGIDVSALNRARKGLKRKLDDDNTVKDSQAVVKDARPIVKDLRPIVKDLGPVVMDSQPIQFQAPHSLLRQQVQQLQNKQQQEQQKQQQLKQQKQKLQQQQQQQMKLQQQQHQQKLLQQQQEQSDYEEPRLNAISAADRMFLESLLLEDPPGYGAKRPRVMISDIKKKEMLDFCKKHIMLKHGEIAEIFGCDRTTVTKMIRKQQKDVGPYELPVPEAAKPQYELEDYLYRYMNSAMKKRCGQPAWSCKQLLAQAVELQKLSSAGHSFTPTYNWLLDFIERFRIQGYVTDYSIAVPTGKHSPSNSHEQPKKQQNVKQSASRKIPKENKPEYTIVETPLESVTMKLEPIELEPEPEPEELDTETAMNRELKSLEKFREQQQAIEEANKQKKALLARTLTERKQRAKKEAHKLEHIQKELSRLDNLLTADVQVIRGKIEEASRDFLDAQKRFEKAENEYVSAKMALHDKTELKEQLTEHLYTIIHQNEVRKAKKLADLMEELDMVDGENDDLELPQLPPLTTFQPPHQLLSPTGGKSSPGQSQFKIVEDSVCSLAPKNPEKDNESSAKTGENESSTKTGEDKTDIVSASPTKSELTENNDDSEKAKDCDKNSDYLKHKEDNSSVDALSGGNSAIKADTTDSVTDNKSENPKSSDSTTSKALKTGDREKLTKVNETGDNCSESESLKNVLEEVVKSKWNFDGTQL